jgi:hypothetical protein
VSTAFAVIVLGVSTTLAARGNEKPASQAAQAPAPDYVEATGFKNRVFEIKHRDPNSLVPVLKPLASGFKGATMAASSEYRTLSVRDVPENLATIEEAIARLDVVQSPRRDIELHLQILVASPTGGTGELPSEIRGAVAQVQTAFNYKGFTPLAPIVQRTREGEWNTEGRGEGGTQNNPNYFTYTYSIRSISRLVDETGVSRIQLNGFGLVFGGPMGDARVQSNLSLRDGEQVVVGTASLRGGNALVLVLSAKVVS